LPCASACRQPQRGACRLVPPQTPRPYPPPSPHGPSRRSGRVLRTPRGYPLRPLHRDSGNVARHPHLPACREASAASVSCGSLRMPARCQEEIRAGGHLSGHRGRRACIVPDCLAIWLFGVRTCGHAERNADAAALPAASRRRSRSGSGDGSRGDGKRPPPKGWAGRTRRTHAATAASRNAANPTGARTSRRCRTCMRVLLIATQQQGRRGSRLHRRGSTKHLLATASTWPQTRLAGHCKKVRRGLDTAAGMLANLPCRLASRMEGKEAEHDARRWNRRR
jgi:hypothetical protein